MKNELQGLFGFLSQSLFFTIQSPWLFFFVILKTEIFANSDKILLKFFVDPFHQLRANFAPKFNDQLFATSEIK